MTGSGKRTLPSRLPPKTVPIARGTRLAFGEPSKRYSRTIVSFVLILILRIASGSPAEAAINSGFEKWLVLRFEYPPTLGSSIL